MLIPIEGNIGAGKSIVLDILQTRGYNVQKEPIEEWNDWLQRFYDDKNRWAFGFQMKALASIVKYNNQQCSLVERSCLSCRNVFGQLLYNHGHMSIKEWELYKSFCDLVSWIPQHIIYIHTPANMCLDRIKQRNRPGEAAIDNEYIAKLEFQYQNMLKYYGGSYDTIDGTQSPENIADEIERIIIEKSSNNNLFKTPCL